MKEEIGEHGKKIGRNQRLYDYWKTHKTTMAAAGRMFKLSKQRATKIISDMDREAKNEKGLLPSMWKRKSAVCCSLLEMFGDVAEERRVRNSRVTLRQKKGAG